MQHLRDLGRRKVRTTLTILGITIGIWALVVFGSMAKLINALVEGGGQYYAGKLTLSDATTGSVGGFAAAPMSIRTVHAVQAVEGVDLAFPVVMMLMDEQTSGMSMGVPPMINGGVADADAGRETFEIRIAQGRDLTPADEGSAVAVLGSDIARKFAKGAGDTIDLRGTSFEVVGVMEPTLTAPDQAASVPLAAAQTLLHESLPPVMQTATGASDLVTSIIVFPDAGVDVEQLADRIEREVPQVSAMSAADFDQQIGSVTAIFNAIIIGVALISLIVGGLSVINTMAMSIAERTREIGIKRAIGGSRFRIVRELVVEAALIGFIGGAIGLALGMVVVQIANEMGRSSGTVLFEMTIGTAVSAVLFSTLLGGLAGFVPALHAARLDPVTALRYE
jgi:putative ABC transport system permease protein